MHNLIAHALVRNSKDEILIIRRTMIKRGKENFEGGKWDIPGGTVEEMEFPSVAAEREAKEEVNLDVTVEGIVFEKSNLDTKKNKIFTTLIYSCRTVNDSETIRLDLEEHDDYKWATKEDISTMKNYELVSYMKELMQMI